MDVTVRRWKLLIVAAIALSGCQMTDPTIELLESELRWMEDQLYTMDRQLDRTCQQLASSRNSNRALRRELTTIKEQGDEGASESTPTPAADRLMPPAVDVPDVDDFDPDSLQVPRVELGPDAEASGLPNPSSPPVESAPPRVDENLDLDDFTQDGDVDVKVARIALNSRLTGGYDFDGRPGDEGLLLVVEPQNASGQYVPLPGHLEVDVTDPRRPGPAARLARWEFETSETVPLLKKSLLGRGMHLQLAWPGHLPDSEKLRVSVRFTPVTGKTLKAEREIRVDLIARQPKPDSVSRIPTGLPGQFVPRPSPRLTQLIPESVLTAPSAPVTAPSRRPERLAPGRRPESSVPNTAIQRRSRAARILRPQWSPYR